MSRYFRKSRKSNHNGFTLPEVIVALSVLVMVIVASSQLLVTIVRNNNENVNTLVAYELAQEALEGVRNIRDSDWLIGADFQGKIGANLLWGVPLPAHDGSHYYILDANRFEDGACSDTVTASTVSSCAPWILKEFSFPNGQEASDVVLTQLYLHDQQGVFQYIHAAQPQDQPSLFHRYVKITALDDQEKISHYRVSAFVTWQENNRPKKISLTTELTDWKGGPL